MTALQKRVDAMEQVGAGPLADEAMRKLICIQLQKYEKQLAAVLRELEPIERQHGMSSEECHRRFVAGEIGDAADIMEMEAGTTGPGCASDPRVPQPAAVAGPGASRAQSALSRNWVASCFWKGVL